MKITIARNAILPALHACALVAEKASASPGSSHVIIDARDGLRLSATDGAAASIRTGVEGAKVSAPGHLAVNARDALERVKSMPDGDILIEEKDSTLVIRSGKRRHVLKALPGADSPAFPEPVDAPERVIAAERIAWLLEHVLHASSTDVSRLPAYGVGLSTEGGRLQCDATDGHRAAMVSTPVDWTIPAPVMVGLKTAQALARLCDVEGDVGLRIGANRIALRVGATEYTSLLPAAAPPPTRYVCSRASTPSIATVPRLVLIEALRAVSLGAEVNDKDGARVVTLKFTGKALAITGIESEDAIPCDLEGPDCETHVASGYLCDSLGAIDGDEVRMGLAGVFDPVILRPSNDADVTMLAMPRMK